MYLNPRNPETNDQLSPTIIGVERIGKPLETALEATYKAVRLFGRMAQAILFGRASSNIPGLDEVLTGRDKRLSARLEFYYRTARLNVKCVLGCCQSKQHIRVDQDGQGS